jgi:type VI protein secretion system component VasK
MSNLIAALIGRSSVAMRETSVWAKNKLLVSLLATVAVRVSTQHFGRSHMTWREVGLDLLIVITCYLTVLGLSFIWNFIFAPARLERERKQELKRKAGQEGLNQVLAEEAKKINEAVDDILDADEEKEG